MRRERWFYAKDMRRTGPLPRRQLVESLLSLPDPRGCLIWRHGLPAWTPAREVPEIDRQLAPFVKAPPAPVAETAPSRAGSLGAGGHEPTTERTARVPGPKEAQPTDEGKRPQQPNVALYFGGLATLLALVVVGWLLWPRPNGPSGPPPPGEARPRVGPPASQTGGAPSTDRGPSAAMAGFTGWGDQEADLPPAELRRLRGVGGWSGDTLTITLYNGSAWRITEIFIRTSRLKGDEFQDSDAPHRLLPAGAAPLDAGTAELLKKVAPDRRKAGVNPLDTGPFEASVGPQPEAYRWRIEGARGYPPRP
ncbi:MAG TPA: DUF4339 domain-containing protein [Vicinamibacteria bacterium]